MEIAEIVHSEFCDCVDCVGVNPDVYFEFGLNVTEEENEILAEALAAARRGWHVFPLHTIVKGKCTCGKNDCESSGKHPRQSGGFYNATTDEQTLYKWFKGPFVNLGLRTGKESGIIVLDVDPDKGGAEALAEFENQYGHTPETAEVLTGGGGRHLYFKYPGFEIKNSVQKIALGLDIRGDGGYAILPRSRHISGRCYEWELSSHPDDVSLAEIPKWLLELIIGENSGNGRAEPVNDAIPEGQRNDKLTSLAGTLRRRGLNADEIYTSLQSVNRNRCYPPLTENEIRNIAKSVERYAPTKCLNEAEVSLDDFYAYMPMHSYIFAPCRDMWPALSVNARIPPVTITDSDGKPILNDKEEPKKIAANAWLDRNQAVETMTWAPAESMLIKDRLISHGGWIERTGCTTFNLYRPPQIALGDAAKADPWLELVYKVYPSDAKHVIKFFAHRVQKPHEKINHAIVLGGLQGIGKDTILEPVKLAVGPWNFQEISPVQLLGRFNGFVKAVILRVSEAHDLGDLNRYAFYERLKAYTATPPDVLQCDEKHIREYYVFNLCGVVITTNYKTDGIYLPADDRRHYVAWSELEKDNFKADYWTGLYNWYREGGVKHVAAYLNQFDISEWDAKAPPPKTAAFLDIVDANRAPEDAELADVLDALGNPDAVTISEIVSRAGESFRDWLTDRKNSRQIPHRMEDAGYEKVRNDAAKDGCWVFQGKRQVIYAKRELSVRERIIAAQNHIRNQ